MTVPTAYHDKAVDLDEVLAAATALLDAGKTAEAADICRQASKRGKVK